MFRRCSRVLCLSYVGLVAFHGLAAVAFGQTPATERRLLEPRDYGRFESLSAHTINADGEWIAYRLTRVDETAELHIRSLTTGSPVMVPWGERHVFSANGRWIAWGIGISPDERERKTKANEPIRLKAEVMDLTTGTRRDLGVAASFEFDPTGRFLVVRGYAPTTPKGSGADIRVLDLESVSETPIGNVTTSAWHSQQALLAVTIGTGTDQGNGVQVLNASTGALVALDASGSEYAGLAWRKDAADLAVLKSRTAFTTTPSAYSLLAWRGLGDGRGTRLELDPTGAGVPTSLEVVKHRTPTWSEDGLSLSFGVRPVQAAPSTDATAAKAPELPGVQIWHSTDVRIIPMQRARNDADQRSSLLSVWRTSANRVVVVGTDLLAPAEIAAGWRHGLERIDTPYAFGAKFGRRYHDLFVVDLDTGTRRRAIERVRHQWTSTGGRYVLFFDNRGVYHTLDLQTGQQRAITAGVKAQFADTNWDTPTDNFLPPHGVGGWLPNDEGALLYDEFDVWKVAPDGSGAERLTTGATDAVAHRVLTLDPTEPALHPNNLYFNIRGEWTEARGYARWSATAGYQRLLLEEKSFWAPVKASKADRVLFRREARDDAPDLFVANADFAARRVVVETNPFLSEYHWTRAELVEYRNKEGRRLHGSLLYPANHDPAKKYPMIVYAYELLSSQHHYWQSPSERNYYNFTAWTQQGYFVLLPDIHFRGRDPGVSLAETLASAITVIDTRGLIDRAKVGFIGHSFGGYHAAYLGARTKLFATTVSGAPLTDFVSFMGQIHWTPGTPEPDHWETGQARMEVPYWEDPDAHERNSPLHGVDTMTTPILMAHGNKDGVVEFFQSTVFYNFVRRAEKPMVLLVYEEEDHSFQKKANQIDYHRRILEWFGHYLKGETAPEWITTGVSWQTHDAEKKRVAGGGGR